MNSSYNEYIEAARRSLESIGFTPHTAEAIAKAQALLDAERDK